jgi:hypothetical protein
MFAEESLPRDLFKLDNIARAIIMFHRAISLSKAFFHTIFPELHD